MEKKNILLLLPLLIVLALVTASVCISAATATQRLSTWTA
jgi:hypothetical protein